MTAAPWGFVDAQAKHDNRGKLAILEAPRDLPFVVRRVFYVYDLPPGSERGAHAHRRLHQCLVCLTGSLDVDLDDGARRETVHVADPARALYIPPLTWAVQRNITPGTAYFVLASAPYDDADYLRSYRDFLDAVRA